MKIKINTILLVTLAITAVMLAGCGKSEGETLSVKSEIIEDVKGTESMEIMEIEKIEKVKAEENDEDILPINIPEEYYSYASLLQGMLYNTEYFWNVVPEKGYGTMEQSEFAVADINGDGQKELVTKHMNQLPDGDLEWEEITVYQYDENTGAVAQRTFEGSTDFYVNGMSVMSHYARIHMSDFPEVTICRGEVIDATLFVRDAKYDPEGLMTGEPFPYEKDADGDGYIYELTFWSNELPGETFYLTEAEYHEKLTEIVDDSEKVELEWQGIKAETVEGMLSAFHDNYGKNKEVFENKEFLTYYILYKAYVDTYDLEESVNGFLESYYTNAVELSDRRPEQYFEDILPSAEFVGREDETLIYQIKAEDFIQLSKEAFGKEIDVTDVVSENVLELIDEDTLEYYLIPMSIPFETEFVLLDIQTAGDKVSFSGVFNVVSEGIYGTRFDCVLEKNENSTLDGYRILECTTKAFDYNIY